MIRSQARENEVAEVVPSLLLYLLLDRVLQVAPVLLAQARLGHGPLDQVAELEWFTGATPASQ
jgi:hypothetical protein